MCRPPLGTFGWADASRVRALSAHKKPLRLKARGAGISLPIPLNENVSAQSSKQRFRSFHAQQNCLRAFKQTRMPSIRRSFKQTRMSSTLRSFRQTKKSVRPFHNSAISPVGSSFASTGSAQGLGLGRLSWLAAASRRPTILATANWVARPA